MLELCFLEMVFVAYPYCLSKQLFPKFPIGFSCCIYLVLQTLSYSGFQRGRTPMEDSVFWDEMCFKGDSVFVYMYT